ncbi:hypothetical protein ACU686_04655 [Yinghuangia aomiensis]
MRRPGIDRAAHRAGRAGGAVECAASAGPESGVGAARVAASVSAVAAPGPDDASRVFRAESGRALAAAERSCMSAGERGGTPGSCST